MNGQNKSGDQEACSIERPAFTGYGLKFDTLARVAIRGFTLRSNWRD